MIILRQQFETDCYFRVISSRHWLEYCHFLPQFNILQASLFSHENIIKFLKVLENVYLKYFSLVEIQEILFSSNEFILHLINQREAKQCEDLVYYLKKIFKGNEKSLEKYLLRKIEPTNFNIFNFFNDTITDKNVEVFRKLLDYTKNLTGVL